jgi:hypothetical protein
MSWDRIYPLAQEIEMWMSLVVNGWLIGTAVVFLVARIIRTTAQTIDSIADSLHLLSGTLALTIPLNFIVCWITNNGSFFYWQACIGIASAALALALRGFQSFTKHYRYPSRRQAN